MEDFDHEEYYRREREYLDDLLRSATPIELLAYRDQVRICRLSLLPADCIN